MPKRYKIMLSEEEMQKLTSWVKNPPRPYLRERARAILNVSQGKTLQATSATLRVRVHRNAVAEWVKRFLSDRLEGLKIKAGRGRKAVFFPCWAKKQPETKLSTCYTSLPDNMVCLVPAGGSKMLAEL